MQDTLYDLSPEVELHVRAEHVHLPGAIRLDTCLKRPNLGFAYLQIKAVTALHGAAPRKRSPAIYSGAPSARDLARVSPFGLPVPQKRPIS